MYTERRAIIGALLVALLLGAGWYGYTTHTSMGNAHTFTAITDSSWFKSHFGTTTPSSASAFTGETTIVATSTKKNSAPLNAPSVAQSPASKLALQLALPPLRNAGVNIICIPTDKSLRAISGSGVIIDSRGVIITAAHVGQYFLFQDYPTKNYVSCQIRIGSPATSAYTAHLIYISRTWLANNPRTMVDTAPQGTGENDFALLAIDGSATQTPIPNSFPSVTLGTEEPYLHEPVVIGSYGAEFIDSSRVRTQLYPTLVFGTVQDRFTFDTDSVDLISLGGNAAAQEGSSGGGIENALGKLIGVITTSTTGNDFTKRELHAITDSHIRRSFAHDTGQSFDSFLASGSLAALIARFGTESNTLAKTIVRSATSN